MADVLLKLLTGEWKSKHVKSKILTSNQFDKMADRVCELESQQKIKSTESAVNQTAKEFKKSERLVWKAVGLRRFQETFTEETISKLAGMREAGENAEAITSFLRDRLTLHRGETTKRLK